MYGFKKININTISNYKYQLDDIHYTYKNYDFLYKNRNKKKLVVFFHGAFTDKMKERVVFRGYNYKYDNSDILSISDINLKLNNKNVLLTWYLSTPNRDNISIYSEIIKSVIKNKYDKVIFTGSSGGGYPSLLFSSIFNGYCLISNSQIYLEKYVYFDTMLLLMELSKDNLNYDIEKFILQNGPPKMLYLYNNIYDINHYKNHAIPFNNFMLNNYPKNIKTIFFEGIDPPIGKSSHHVQYPNENTYYDVIKDVL